MFVLCSFVLLICILTTNQQSCDFSLDVVTDLKPKDCYDQKKYFTIEDCLPICKSYPRTATGKCDDATPCIPGYYCDKATSRCIQDTETCAIYYANYLDNPFFSSVFKPTCLGDGSWESKQCKGESTTGRCFCYDGTGKRMFGNEWSSSARDMSCACSRRKADLRAEGSKYFVSLHCDNRGNYEPLQCDVETGLCWCADNKSGELKSAVVPQSAMNRLPCYNVTAMGGQYLRQCDSKLYAQARILNELKIHGTTDLMFQTLLCDEDGAYGPYEIQDGNAYCTWRDNTKIRSYQGDASSDISLLNCNCARDTMIYEQAGQTLIQQCLGSGNYKPYQKIGNVGYCVDNDGFKISQDDETIRDENDCTVTA